MSNKEKIYNICNFGYYSGKYIDINGEKIQQFKMCQNEAYNRSGYCANHWLTEFSVEPIDTYYLEQKTYCLAILKDYIKEHASICGKEMRLINIKKVFDFLIKNKGFLYRNKGYNNILYKKLHYFESEMAEDPNLIKIFDVNKYKIELFLDKISV